MRTTALIALATELSGCSFIATKSPPPVTTANLSVEPDCSESRVAPVADAFGTGMMAFSTLLLLALADLGSSSNDDDVTAFALTFGGGTILFGISAVTGFGRTSACRRARESWYTTRAQIQMQMQPPPIYVQQPPPLPQVAPGTERGHCRLPPAPPCDVGLACASGFCVRPPS